MADELTKEELDLIMGGTRDDTRMPPHPVEHTGTPRPLTVADAQRHPIHLFRRLSGAGIVLFFGATGSGKTKTVLTLTRDALAEAMSVTYYDLEGNIHPKVVERLVKEGCGYIRATHLADVYRRVADVKTNVIVVDSATLQITGRWFGESQNERGKTLQEVQYLYQKISDWCAKTGGLAFIVAQPVSEFGGRQLFPMGDKGSFYTKSEMFLRYERGEDGITVTRRELVVFKDRILPNGMKICDVKTSLIGVEFGKINPDVIRILDELGA